ncbi:MAG: aminoacyl-tRNA hydrolase [Clostridia bacterium]|nr:aminoacyl-tRNA hydrolase [Clostridia bacterium]
MYIIAGLGNPGREYEMTRHNIGFHFIDYFADKYKVKVSKLKYKGLWGEANIGGEKVLLIKPQTYMNLSGECIGEFCSFFKIPPQNVIIISDDVSLNCGNIRIRTKGSAGGHNGLKSIIQHLSSDEFMRVKIGVGSCEDKGIELADYVLGRFSKSEIPVLEDSIIRAAAACELIISGKTDMAMNRYNSKNK